VITLKSTGESPPVRVNVEVAGFVRNGTGFSDGRFSSAFVYPRE